LTELRIINGEPTARWQTPAQIVGVRPGVDGTYNIHNAHHVWSRQGYITQLHVGPNMNTGAGSISSGYLGLPSPGLGGAPPVNVPSIPKV
jgi:hypothetical protein